MQSSLIDKNVESNRSSDSHSLLVSPMAKSASQCAIVSNIGGYPAREQLEETGSNSGEEEKDELKADREEKELTPSITAAKTAYDGKYQFKKLFAAIKDLQKHGVKVSAPEFVFIGFQSSGKTSAVSQAAKTPIGVIQDGTGSRCPTRFRLICNKKAKTKSIRVDDKICQDEAEMIQICCDIHKRLADEQKFSTKIVEVRIESADVPELTFVDLPGLFAGDSEEILDAKRQIDEITAGFLHAVNDNGNYEYIPILVMTPVEKEHKRKGENAVSYVDGIIAKYGPNNNKRTDWKNDAIFVVNKFDKVINVGKAADLLERIHECCGNGQFEENTILTMMNATQQNTANMTNTQLKRFILTAPKDEEDKWQQMLHTFDQKNDPLLDALKRKIKILVGIPRMNEILEERMCVIAKTCLPTLQKKMELAEQNKQKKIDHVTQKLLMCDPLKLKTECIEFGNLFMKYLNELYNGSLMAWTDPQWKKTWVQEVRDFQNLLSISNASMHWEFAIPPNTLQTLIGEALKKGVSPLKSKKPKYDKKNVAALLAMLRMRLMGTTALRRILNAWKCQVEFMSFPDYTDEDFMNIAGGFDATIQPSVWVAIRNVVLASIHHLSDAVQYLGEMYRYKLKENADIIFEYVLKKKFGADGFENTALIRLLQRTLRDYKKEVDNLIDEFIASIEVERKVAQVLDGRLCEETILIGKYVADNLKNKRDPYEINKVRKAPVSSRNIENPLMSPRDLKNPEPHLMILDADEEEDQIEKVEVVAAGNGAKFDGFPSDDENKNEEEMEESQGRPLMGIADRFDRDFFEAMNIVNRSEVPAKILLDATDYDIETIKRYSFMFWTILKQTMIREIIQKVSNHVMAYVTQHEKLANAVHVGVDRRNVQRLLNNLVQSTGVDYFALEEFVKKHQTRHIEQSINDLNEDDLKQVYGIDLEGLRKERQQKLDELEEYKRLKMRTMQKIYLIKNGNFEKSQEEENDESVVDEDTEEMPRSSHDNVMPETSESV